MSCFTNALEDLVITHLFRTGTWTKPTTLYVGLLSAVATPEAGGVTELVGNGYARVPDHPADANWAGSVGGNGTTSNVNPVSFAAASADWVTATHWGIWDSLTNGTLLIYAPLTSPRTVTNGSTPTFGVGALTVQVDN